MTISTVKDEIMRGERNISVKGAAEAKTVYGVCCRSFVAIEGAVQVEPRTRLGLHMAEKLIKVCQTDAEERMLPEKGHLAREVKERVAAALKAISTLDEAIVKAALEAKGSGRVLHGPSGTIG